MHQLLPNMGMTGEGRHEAVRQVVEGIQAVRAMWEPLGTT